MTTTALAPASAPATSPAQQGPEPKRRLFTVDEYCAMADAGILCEDERVELLDGEIIVMPPIGEPHEDSTDILNSDLSRLLRGRARVRVQNSVRLDDYGLPQPDIAVVRLCDDYNRRRPAPEDVLLLIEVADTSLEFDREVKLARYAAAGIPEVHLLRSVDGSYQPAGGDRRRFDQPAGVSRRVAGLPVWRQPTRTAGGGLLRSRGWLIPEPAGGDRRRFDQPAGVSRRVAGGG